MSVLEFLLLIQTLNLLLPLNIKFVFIHPAFIIGHNLSMYHLFVRILSAKIALDNRYTL